MGLNKINKKEFIAMLLVIIALFLFLNSEKRQSNDITYNFFSGAANSTLTEWRISTDDPILKDKYNINSSYKFYESTNYIVNKENDFGYVLIIKIAKILFPWFGDINAVKIFQFCVHIIVFISFYRILNGQEIYLFFILFSANPFIIKYALFPFYYYLTVLPTCIFLVTYLTRSKSMFLSWIFFAILAIVSVSRSTIFLLVIPYLYIAYKYKINFYKNLLPLSLSILIVIYFSTIYYKSIWHTAYIGIGAYPNPFGIIGLDDTNAINYFKSISSTLYTQIVTEINYGNVEAWKEYNNILKNKYLSILFSEHYIIIRNMLLNIILLFGFGYINNYPLLTTISLFYGLLNIFFIYKFRLYDISFALLFSSILVVLLIPPLPIYIMPSLLINVILFIEIIKRIRPF
jgi:hypothetical protein